jgi:hypothetical protein
MELISKDFGASAADSSVYHRGPLFYAVDIIGLTFFVSLSVLGVVNIVKFR